MLEALILLTATEPDGTTTIRQTDDCAYHVTYDNRLAAGPGTERHEVDGVTVVIVKGPGERPESVYVTAWGVEHTVRVNDNTTGVICVPWPLMG